MRQKAIVGTMALFLVLITTLAQGQRFNEFRGFGDDVPPAPQDFGGFPGGAPPVPVMPNDAFAWPNQPAAPQWGGAQWGQPMQDPSLQTAWPEQPQFPTDPGNWQQQGFAQGGAALGTGGGFTGFGDDLPPAAPMTGMGPTMAPSAQATGGMDMNALMGMMGNMQGGQGGQVDMNALMAMMGTMQGGQAGGMDMNALMSVMGGAGGGGDATTNQLLQMLGQMYGVDMSQGIDPSLIQQGLANLEELQTWEGMEGIDFGPLINMLRGGGMAGQQGLPSFDPAMMQQLMNME